VGPHRVPIVPAAILFDLMNGGDKDWGTYPPYRELGFEAAKAAGRDVALGSHGAGTGALTAGLKGGLGSASVVLENGTIVAALVAVNAIGSIVFGHAGHFWAAPFEFGAEFGGRGMRSYLASQARSVPAKHRRLGISDSPLGGTNTTIAVIATDASLTKAEAKRLAIAAHDGFARAIWPAHTPMDGDLVFSLATGTDKRRVTTDEFIDLCAAAASTMARAVARGIYEASPADGDVMDTWQAMHGSL
jgi:L-aminopeptidase/D-esterase-like protein